jgi:hypothetical protein
MWNQLQQQQQLNTQCPLMTTSTAIAERQQQQRLKYYIPVWMV